MKTSKLWDSLVRNQFAKIDASFLASFREPGNANNRLAAWDPYDKSMRYFKFLFFHQLQAKNTEFFANYAKIGPTSLGNPVVIMSTSGQSINLDHFFSIEEYTFLDANLNTGELRHILEIGAGFGRTAQALVNLFENVEVYTIVDLPEVLALSRAYLGQVLEATKFAKLRFVNALTLEAGQEGISTVDLVINIDSFQEMPRQTIEYYFRRFIDSAGYFFSKNAIGKYSPESVGLRGIDESQLLDVFSLGLSTRMIDIFNPADLALARTQHVDDYRPNASFTVVAQEPLGIFPYYHNVLYARDITR
jgi:putative sugar O-methyltransferase